MKFRVYGSVACMAIFGCLALQDTGFRSLTVDEEREVVAGQEGYYCGEGSGGCAASGAPPSPADAENYWCDESLVGKDGPTTWCPGSGKNQKCLQTWTWWSSCSERTQGCERQVSVCKKVTDMGFPTDVWAYAGVRTLDYSGCGDYTKCD